MFHLNMIIGWDTSYWDFVSFIFLIFEILHINHIEDNKVFGEQQTILELKNYAFIPFHLSVIGEKRVHWSRIKPSRHVWQGQTLNVKGKSHILPWFRLWVCNVLLLDGHFMRKKTDDFSFSRTHTVVVFTNNN